MISTGLFLLIPGGIGGFYGVLKMKSFFDALPNMGKLTVSVLFKELILPHTLFLFGFGAFAFGLLLLTKGIVFHFQQKRLSS